MRACFVAGQMLDYWEIKAFLWGSLFIVTIADGGKLDFLVEAFYFLGGGVGLHLEVTFERDKDQIFWELEAFLGGHPYVCQIFWSTV